MPTIEQLQTIINESLAKLRETESCINDLQSLTQAIKHTPLVLMFIDGFGDHQSIPSGITEGLKPVLATLVEKEINRIKEELDGKE